MNAPVKHQRALSLAPKSLDRDARTFEAIASTGADVARSGFVERLEVSAAAINPDRLVGAPLLDSHRTGSTRDVLGRIDSYRFEDGNLIVVARVARGDVGEAILDKIDDGMLRGVSLGYAVNDFRDERGKDGRVLRIVTKWTPAELSLVPLPADPGATIRSTEMPEPIEQQSAPVTTGNTRAEINTEIRSIASLSGLDQTWIDTQLDAEATVDAARAAAFEAMAKRGPAIRNTRASVTFSHEDPAVLRKRATDAMAYLMRPNGDPDDEVRELVNSGPIGIARRSLERADVDHRNIPDQQIMVRAGMHTTSDFPAITIDAQNVVAEQAFEAAQSPLMTICRQRNVVDFKPQHTVRAGMTGRLEGLNEAGEIKHTTRAENAEQMRLKTKAIAINFTREVMINARVEVLGDTISQFGESAAQTMADELTALLLSNPNLSDGAAVYSTDRGNLESSGGPISEATLDAGRQAMRGRKDLDDKTLINAQARYLVVGADRETEAQKVLAAITPNSSGDVNVFSGAFTLLVEPRITDGSWYLFADSSRLPVLQYGFLDSAPGVQVEQKDAWTTLGTSYRAWLDFGSAYVGWRGVHKNPGA